MPTTSKHGQLGELAFDLQTGLGRLDVPEYDTLRLAGMAAVLAIHIKGLVDIPFDVLRKVADHYFEIPSYALRAVLAILAETELVRLVTEGKTIKKIIPTVPFFSNVYEVVGEYGSGQLMNDHEALVLGILNKLKDRPYNQESLRHSLGAEVPIMTRTLQITEAGNIVRKHRARGQDIIVSPLYFSDGLDALADLAASKNIGDLVTLLDKIKRGQGWPLSLALKTDVIGTARISSSEKALLRKLTAENIIKPPSLRIGSKDHHFLFTPRPGAGRLNATNRIIYEKAMALVSAVRKGQLLPEAYRIRMPRRILEVLKERGYIRANTEAGLQYSNLVRLRVGRLEHVGGGWYRFSLIDTPENKSALELAIGLVSTGELANIEVNQEAILALSKDELYIDSIVGAAELRGRPAAGIDEDAKKAFDNILLGST
jgi:hypothetical protein